MSNLLRRGGAKGWEALINQGKSRIQVIGPGRKVDAFYERCASWELFCALEI